MNICSMCNAPSTRYLTLILVDDVNPNNINNRVEITGHYCDSCLASRIMNYAIELGVKSVPKIPPLPEGMAEAMLEMGRPLGEDLTHKEDDSQKWAKEYITAPVVDDEEKIGVLDPLRGEKYAKRHKEFEQKMSKREKEMSPEEKALRQKEWDAYINRKDRKSNTLVD